MFAESEAESVLCRGTLALFLAIGLAMPFDARADEHYVGLSKIFPSGKCSPVIPNFELMVSLFAGGELTEHKIQNGQGEVVETITTVINKERDQWITVGSRRDQKVIFCLYASGIGPGSVTRRTLQSR
jgi:hypothetical protein